MESFHWINKIFCNVSIIINLISPMLDIRLPTSKTFLKMMSLFHPSTCLDLKCRWTIFGRHAWNHSSLPVVSSLIQYKSTSDSSVITLTLRRVDWIKLDNSKSMWVRHWHCITSPSKSPDTLFTIYHFLQGKNLEYIYPRSLNFY